MSHDTERAKRVGSLRWSAERNPVGVPVDTLDLLAELAHITAERDEAIAALERYRVAAVNLRDSDEGKEPWDDLFIAINSTTNDLAASQRRAWRASGMEEAADAAKARRDEVAGMSPDMAWTTGEVMAQVNMAVLAIRDLARQERGNRPDEDSR